jgi:hypothetical protein
MFIDTFTSLPHNINLHCKDSGNATRPGEEKYYIFQRTEQWLQYYKKLRSIKKIGSLAGGKNINKEGRLKIK